jgi:hypothetical protein
MSSAFQFELGGGGGGGGGGECKCPIAPLMVRYLLKRVNYYILDSTKTYKKYFFQPFKQKFLTDISGFLISCNFALILTGLVRLASWLSCSAPLPM